MFTPILISIVSVLVIASINATYSAKISQFIQEKKPHKIEQLHNQEKSVKDAVNSYCEKNLNSCVSSDNTGLFYLSITDIKNYMPQGTLEKFYFDQNSFSEVYLDLDNNKIVIKHLINDPIKQNEYKEHFINKKEQLIIENNLIRKIYSMSPKLDLLLNQKKENDLKNQLDSELSKEKPDSNLVSELTLKIEKIINKKNISQKNLDKFLSKVNNRNNNNFNKENKKEV